MKMPLDIPQGVIATGLIRAWNSMDFSTQRGFREILIELMRTPPFSDVLSEASFGRVDGFVPPPPESRSEDWFAGLSAETPGQLLARGCIFWDFLEDHRVHWLYPAVWYNDFPDGLPVLDVHGRMCKFTRREYQPSSRFGILAFGFLAQPWKNPSCLAN